MYIKVNNIVLNNFNDYLDYIKTINLNTIEEIFISSYINDSIAFDESLLDNDNKYIYYINFNKFINIKKITCKYLKNLSQIIINNCKKLKEITLIDCNIKKFPSYKNPNLKYICCINCNLNNININEFPQLKELIIEKNNIKYLDASKNKNLKVICARHNINIKLNLYKKLYIGNNDKYNNTLNIYPSYCYSCGEGYKYGEIYYNSIFDDNTNTVI